MSEKTYATIVVISGMSVFCFIVIGVLFLLRKDSKRQRLLANMFLAAAGLSLLLYLLTITIRALYNIHTQ